MGAPIVGASRNNAERVAIRPPEARIQLARSKCQMLGLL